MADGDGVLARPTLPTWKVWPWMCIGCHISVSFTNFTSTRSPAERSKALAKRSAMSKRWPLMPQSYFAIPPVRRASCVRSAGFVASFTEGSAVSWPPSTTRPPNFEGSFAAAGSVPVPVDASP